MLGDVLAMIGTTSVPSTSRLTLSTGLHSSNDTAPSVHDTFTERHNIVKHLIAALRTGSDSGCLIKNLCHYRKVGLEVTRNGTCNIAEALQNGRLELVGQGGAL